MFRIKAFLIALRSVRGRLARYGGTAAALLLVVWVVGVLLLPGPEDPFTRRLSWGALLAGLFVLAAEVHATLYPRHKYPPFPLLGSALCVLLCGWCLWREPSAGVAVRVALPLLLAAGSSFYDYWFSMLPRGRRTSRLRVGDRFPDFDLPDSGNRRVTLPAVLAKGPALFVFYKGDW